MIGEGHLRHVLRACAGHHKGTRTHLSLNKDTPLARPILREVKLTPYLTLVVYATQTSGCNLRQGQYG